MREELPGALGISRTRLPPPLGPGNIFNMTSRDTSASGASSAGGLEEAADWMIFSAAG